MEAKRPRHAKGVPPKNWGGERRLGVDPVDQASRERAEPGALLVLCGMRTNRGVGSEAPAPWGRFGRCPRVSAGNWVTSTKRETFLVTLSQAARFEYAGIEFDLVAFQ